MAPMLDVCTEGTLYQVVQFEKKAGEVTANVMMFAYQDINLNEIYAIDVRNKKKQTLLEFWGNFQNSQRFMRKDKYELYRANVPNPLGYVTWLD